MALILILETPTAEKLVATMVLVKLITVYRNAIFDIEIFIEIG